MPVTQSTSIQMVREFLKADARLREASAARFMVRLAAVCIPVALGLGPIIGWTLSAGIAALLATLVLYYLVVLFALRRGYGGAVVSWANTFIETSALVPIMCMDTIWSGAEYALSAPPLALWGGLITLSALRASRVKSISAGALACVEYLVVYFVLIRPRLPLDSLVTFSPPFIILRAFFLLCCGFATAIVTHHLLRKAEEALRAVRAQDLMSKYFLQGKIAEGGMGEVYKAVYSPEGGFEKTVAVKRILPSASADPKFVQMFLEEARLCAGLHHPNIVQVFDVGRYKGAYLLAMEFVDGVSLHRLITGLGRPLPLPVVTYLAAETAFALDYLHRRSGPTGAPLKLVHCDVNPPNILVSRIGEVKLGDFGVARAVSSLARAEMRGKVGYMAPEQLMGQPIDGRTDLYALGLTIHEALTGLPAIPRASGMGPRVDRINRPSALRRDVPMELDDCVMRLLEVDSSKRTATGRELRLQLTALVGPCAPYPDGSEMLARLVAEVMGRQMPTTAGSPTEINVGQTIDMAIDVEATASIRSSRAGRERT